MTFILQLPQALKDFDKFFVGYDDQFNRLAKLHDDLTKGIPNYPPYNIRKTSDNTYVIELAVAGFGKQEIDITLDDHIEIQDAALVNGMLKIALERIIPEHKKPKKIEVKEKESKTIKKEFLVEDAE